MKNEIKSTQNDFEVVPLDDPEFLEAQKKRNEALNRIAELSEEIELAKKEYDKKNDEWWNGLSYDERCDAFYAVMKRLYQGEIENNGSYRYVLYDVFDFGPEMYARGMDCGYIVIHNRIMNDEEQKILWDLRKRNV